MNNAKYAFYYLLSLVALVFVAINSGIIVFQLINKLIPDSTTIVNQEMLRFAIASLIFATPVFYGMNKLIKRGLVKGEIALTDGIRRWLTYFIIFVASVVILVWLITTMNSFLNGELTVKVILKTLAILVIAGSIFGYYFYDLKRKDYNKYSPISLAVGLVVGLLIVLGLVVGFMSVDTPNKARLRSLDDKLEESLNNVSFAVFGAYKDTSKLEESYNLNYRLGYNGFYKEFFMNYSKKWIYIRLLFLIDI
jgi:hypothetical protein